MEEVRKRKEAKESELAAYASELEQLNTRVSKLHSRADLTASGLSEERIVAEQQRGEQLMTKMCSLRVGRGGVV